MPVLHRYPQRACVQGLEVEVFKLVCVGATPEQWAEWLRAPLEHAAARGNLDLVNTLLGAGADGRAGWRGCRGRTLLDAAALGGNEDVVTALLQAGCVPDVRAVSVSSRRSALHLAVVCGHEAAARRLILAGADVNYGDPTDKCSPLHVAVAGGHQDLVHDLVIGGGNSRCRDAKGNTPLHVAAQLGHDKIVTTLLGTPSTDKDARVGPGLSPLMLASMHGRLPAVKALLAAGADVTLRSTSSTHRSPLDCAAEWKRNDVITALLEHGADVNAADPVGRTALHRAVRSPRTLNQLLDAGAGVNNKNVRGFTTLHDAAGLCSVKTMLVLLRRGAKADATNAAGVTPLHLACFNQRPRVAAAVDLLLRWGASETAVSSNDGETPAVLLQQRASSRRCSAGDAERARVLLARAPADRAWRRRGWLVMLRATAEKERMAQCLSSSSSSGGGGEVVQGGRRLRGEEEDGGSNKNGRTDDGGGGGGGGDGSTARAGGGDAGDVAASGAATEEGALSGVVAKLVGLELDGVFRTVVGYL